MAVEEWVSAGGNAGKRPSAARARRLIGSSIPVFRTLPEGIANTWASRLTVPAEALVDTGALVSIPDRRQEEHVACRGAYEELAGSLVTTEAAVTETCRLLSRAARGIEACLEFVLEAGMAVVPSTVESMRRALVLARKCRDMRMDYADATLAVLE